MISILRIEITKTDLRKHLVIKQTLSFKIIPLTFYLKYHTVAILKIYNAILYIGVLIIKSKFNDRWIRIML